MGMRRLSPLGDLVERIAAIEDSLRSGVPPAERKSPQAAPTSGSSRTGTSRAATSSGAKASTTASTPKLAGMSERGTTGESEREIASANDDSAKTKDLAEPASNEKPSA